MRRLRSLGLAAAVAAGGAATTGCDEVTTHQCAPIQVLGDTSTGRCDSLGWPHYARLMVWCDGPSHPHGPTPYVSPWVVTNGAVMRVAEGYDNPGACNSPNWVTSRGYDFWHAA